MANITPAIIEQIIYELTEIKISMRRIADNLERIAPYYEERTIEKGKGDGKLRTKDM